MSFSEILLTLIVALIVFGPKKLPELASNLGKLFAYINKIKNQINNFWQQQLNLYQLEQSEKKANVADDFYQKKN